MRIFLALATALFALAAQAQTYPSRPIHLVVPFPPSGATDILSRVVGAQLEKALGQPVVIENKPGAGGSIGSAAVAKAAPDGYTVQMATTSTHSIGPALQKLPYDAEKDFTPISLVASTPNILVVSPALKLSSVKDLIALAKAKPGELNYSSSGEGTIIHLSGELFVRMAGVQMQHVPYKGTALAAPDLKNGQIAMMIDNIVSAIPFMKSGMEQALAVTSAKRSEILPNLPTVAESGVPGYESTAYFGVFGPAGLPPAVVARLNGEIDRIVKSPDTKAKLLDLGAEPVGGPPENLAKAQREDFAKWSKVIREAGVKPQ
jgi:tripartite-type tricarboxylate transporter receptor subunit TctC